MLYSLVSHQAVWVDLEPLYPEYAEAVVLYHLFDEMIDLMVSSWLVYLDLVQVPLREALEYRPVLML